ncbi:hypothetical protein BHE74_00018786 [Ensete ventricosum]|nr:hypothetical protein BHE74_00018786 [Ensete ventricosum]
MLMNLKKGDYNVVNRGKGLMMDDFDGNVSLAEKKRTIVLEPQRCWTWRSGPGELTYKGRGRRQRGDLDDKKMRSNGCNRRSRGCSVSIALQKKMLATQEVRSYRWTMEGYHRQRKGSRSRRQWVHCECQSLEDVGCDQWREWAIAVGG